MKLHEAQALADLRASGQQPRMVCKCKTAGQITAEIFAQAEERGEKFVRTPESWTRHWLLSKRFHLVRMPLNAAALPCEPKVGNLVLKKIHAREEDPVVVDYNKNQVGAAMHGYVPETIVIDGKHRWTAAQLRGESHIWAYVGDEVLGSLPSLQACNCKMKAAGGGGASGGGGPDPESTIPAPGAKLVAEEDSTESVKARGAKRLAKLMVRRGGK